MEDKLYPLGSIVYLEDSTDKVMIISRGVVFEDEEKGDQLADYMGCLYPEGLDIDETIFFNHENISHVVFEGFVDTDEMRFQQMYQGWVDELNVPRAEF